MKKDKDTFKRGLTVLLALVTAAALSGGCENPANEKETQIDAVFEITMWEEKISVTCPANLQSVSQAKLEEVMDLFVSTFAGSYQQGQLETLLSKGVKIIILNDGSVTDCEKSGDYTMLINYEWLSSNENPVIAGKMNKAFNQMILLMTKLIDNSKGTVRGGVLCGEGPCFRRKIYTSLGIHMRLPQRPAPWGREGGATVS
jgi:hypothetical protein